MGTLLYDAIVKQNTGGNRSDEIWVYSSVH